MKNNRKSLQIILLLVTMISFMFKENLKAAPVSVTCRQASTENKYKFETMEFLGKRLSEHNGGLVVATDRQGDDGVLGCFFGRDDTVRARCVAGTTGQYRIFSVSNPQYWAGDNGTYTSEDARIAYNLNTAFWCVKSGSPGAQITDPKKSRCTNPNNLNPAYSRISFVWVANDQSPPSASESGPTGPTSATDGDCYCRRAGDTGNWNLCSNAFLQQLVQSVQADRPATPEAQVADSQKCVDDWVRASEGCARDARNAERDCDRDTAARDSEREMAQMRALGLNLGQSYINSMSGSLQECFLGSVALNAGDNLLRSQVARCGEGTAQCGESCNSEALRQQGQSCLEQAKAAEASYRQRQAAYQQGGRQGTAPQDPMAYWDNGDRRVQNNLDRIRGICRGTTNATGPLNQALNIGGRALASSLQCMCKLSTGTAPGTNCNTAVPPKTDCFMKPSTPGCQAYGALDVCTPGAGYNAASCNCQLNPKSAGCPGGSSGGLSNFGGSSIKAPTADNSGVGFGSPTGGIAGNADIGKMSSDGGGSGPSGEPLKELKSESGAGAPAAFAGGGSGGGAGPASEGNANPSQFAGEGGEEPQGALAGAFSQAKNFVSKSLGLSNGESKGGRTRSGFDASRFRPGSIRGVASNYGYGKKNQDIFKLVNHCYNYFTCKNNENAFIREP